MLESASQGAPLASGIKVEDRSQATLDSGITVPPRFEFVRKFANHYREYGPIDLSDQVPTLSNTLQIKHFRANLR
jgi:hypothetical protein